MAQLRGAVAAPPAVPPTVGLLISARVFEAGRNMPVGDRWESGYAYLPEGCASGGVIDPCEGGTKDIAANPDQVVADPFAVWAGDECSTFGFIAGDAEGRARRQLLATRQFQIEQELWRGDLARDVAGTERKHLAHPDSDVLSEAGALDPIPALACLEEGLAKAARGQRGMIHATRQVAALWHQSGMLRREGNLVLTINDTIVVAGAGYDGSGPGADADADPVAPGVTQWAYATTLVTVRLDEVVLVPGANALQNPTLRAQMVNRDTNTIAVIAEQLAAFDWDGCAHLAVEIDTPYCGLGGLD